MKTIVRNGWMPLFVAAVAAVSFLIGLSLHPQRSGLGVGSAQAQEQPAQAQAAPAAQESKDLVVPLCDSKTRLTVEGVREGEVLEPEQAREVARELMRMHDELVAQEAAAAELLAQQNPQQAETGAVSPQPAGEQAKQATKWTKRDQLIWDKEQKRVVDEGNKVFHDWKAMNGTIGISCDMCHPNASNTHPETYPKFQTQLKRVGTLRDMINWCIENPMKGKPLALDDPKMIAVEAYITSTREGAALAPGKH
jgi:thiosulfate dehydrogenase